MLQLNFCRNFTFISLTSFIAVAYIVIFSIEVVTGLNRKGGFLEISWERLVEMGGNYGPKVAKGELYRLVTASFLHVDFAQITASVFSTFVLVSMVEYTFGPLRTLAIYLICGVSGNLTSLIGRSA